MRRARDGRSRRSQSTGASTASRRARAARLGRGRRPRQATRRRSPNPAETEVPAELRERIEALMARYPDRRSAALPALDAAQRVHGWCSPEAIQPGRRGDARHARLPLLGRDLLRHAAHRAGRHALRLRLHERRLLPARRRRRVYDAIAGEAERQGLEDCDIREFECLGACDMAPMASIDGRYVGPLEPSDAAEIVAALKESREVLPGRGLGDQDYRLPWAGDAPEGELA